MANEDDDIEPDLTVPDTDGRGRLMQEVAAQMDAIETDFGHDFEIGRVVTIVEIKRPGGDVELRVRAQQLPWVSLGMLEVAKKYLETQIGA